MIKKVDHSYDNIVAFEFLGEVNKEDFDQIVIPAIEAMIDDIDKINLVYLLNTDLSEFTMGAWWKDAMLGIQNITKWHKSAIVTDSNAIQNFTEIFSHVMPGEFKGFDKVDLEEALRWAAT